MRRGFVSCRYSCEISGLGLEYAMYVAWMVVHGRRVEQFYMICLIIHIACWSIPHLSKRVFIQSVMAQSNELDRNTHPQLNVSLTALCLHQQISPATHREANHICRPTSLTTPPRSLAEDLSDPSANTSDPSPGRQSSTRISTSHALVL